jgi:putative peptide zinc metalloprotease protein
VAAAGIYVEVTLAACCTFLWWFTQPGVFHSFCFNVMFVCSVGTVLFNGNPLLRYDGYFILADVLDMPNLWQRSRTLVRSACLRWCLGIDAGDQDDLPWGTRAVLGTYGVASILYRWAVLVGIAVFLLGTLQRYRLELLAQLFLGLFAAGMIAMPIHTTRRWLAHPLNAQRLRSGRTWIRIALLGVLACCVLFVPLPYHVAVPVIIESGDAASVYVTAPGRLVHSVQVGDSVAAGQVVAELDNPGLRRAVARLSGDVARQQARLVSLDARRVDDPQAASEIPAAREKLLDLRQQLGQRRSDIQRLSLRAPQEGKILSPPIVPTLHDAGGRLPLWSGTPLDEVNRGCFLETGTLLCLVGDPNAFQAMAYVNQTDTTLVRVGQRVSIHLEQSTGALLQGTVDEVARLDLDATPAELLVRAKIPTRTDSAGVARPLEPVYQVRITLSDPPSLLVDRGGGEAKIRVASKSIGWRISRWFRRTFRVS